MRPERVARAHGIFNVVTGAWPILNMRSFEAVLGPKSDDWLVRTMGCLLVTIGLSQISTSSARGAVSQARKASIAVSGALAAADVVYVAKGRISRMYLLDAAMQLGWVGAWWRSAPPAADRRP